MTFSVDEFGEEYKFSIGKVGYEHCSPSKGPVSRVRPNNAWHFVLFGRGTIETADGKMYKINRGESFLLYQGEYYNYYPDPQDPWTYIWVELTGENLESMFRQCGFTKENFHRALSEFDIYVELLKSMKDSFDESFERVRYLCRTFEEHERFLRRKRRSADADLRLSHSYHEQMHRGSTGRQSRL